MYQSVKSYVHEMGVQDGFYQVMVNTEPSKMRVYGLKEYGRSDIQSLVPELDPTFDEIETSYAAREHGISTLEMRSRRAEAENRCSISNIECEGSILWGLSERVFNERRAQTQKCFPNKEQENSILDLVKTKARPDHPITLKRETCVRDIMLGR